MTLLDVVYGTASSVRPRQRSSIQMEPTRPLTCAILSPWRTAHLQR